MGDPVTRLTELILADEAPPAPRRDRRAAEPVRTPGAEEDARFGPLFDHAPLGVFVSDASEAGLPVVYANAAFGRLVGLDRRAITGKPGLFWLESAPEAPTAAELRAALDGGDEARRFVVKHRDRDGEAAWYELRVSPVPDDQGRLAYVTGFCLDVTEHHLARLEAARQKSELEKAGEALRSEAHLLKKTNRMLRDRQADLVHAEKMSAVGRLAAGVAHEVNNPIGFIRSNLDTLAEYLGLIKHAVSNLEHLAEAVRAEDAEAAWERFTEVDRICREEKLALVVEDVELLTSESIHGADRVREIVQSLKTFARIDEAEVKEADVNDGLRATLRMLHNELQETCTVVDELQPIPRIRCLPGQLNQVFMNLLVNALQAISARTDGERGTITLATEASDEEVFVRVTDTGVGIPEEHLAKLFTPFFTTKPIGQGTGLGLSVSYGIVKKHHGHIDVESEVGRGTTFTIRLPIDGGHAAELRALSRRLKSDDATEP